MIPRLSFWRNKALNCRSTFFTFAIVFTVWSFIAFSSVEVGAQERQGVEFFEAKIRPVLVGHCYRCHSKEANKMKGGLRVDTRDALLAGGDSGAAVVARKPDSSPLYDVLTYHGDYQMPPAGKLPDNVIADFKTWIEMGAPDPRVPIKREPIAPVKSAINVEEGRKFWAYQQPMNPKLPNVEDNWSRSDLDRFVFEELKTNGLEPNADASSASLVRRLYYVLTGLPPTPEAIKTWTNKIGATGGELDQAEITLLVDQLLESNQFGEHWGRHWMDVARFAESTGGDNNNIQPYAWRYRDYVIDAFNNDKPFDRFIMEQLAGDLLPIKNDAEWASNIVATGFLAIGVKRVGEEDQQKFRADLVDDQIDTTTRAFLGTTVSCARCHDHKFDPIPQTDYYSLAGIFRSTNTHYGLIKAQARQAAKLIDLTGLGLSSAKKSLTKKEYAELEQARVDAHAKMDELMQGIRGGNAPTRNILRRTRTLRDTAEAALQAYDAKGNPRVFVMGVQDADFPAENYLLVRGEVDQRAQKVDRGFISVLTPPKRNLLPRKTKGSGRMELAQWIASEENSLTARVMANRVWHWLHGKGIVRTVDDFGSTGERPSNQELLDHLALRLVEHEWSVKSLVREIVLSRTWQLSADYDEAKFAVDPDNRLHWRANPRRLEAESIRDAMLAVSGNLNWKRPVGSFVSRVGEGSVGLSVFEPEIRKIEEPVRSVYLPRVRSVLPELLELFDAPDASLVTGAREETNTPLQSLYLLNNPFAVQQAESFAKRILSKPSSKRLEFAYMAAFGRKPSSEEARLASKFISDNKALGNEKAMIAYCQALICSAEFISIE